jgi:hypothetical protein
VHEFPADREAPLALCVNACRVVVFADSAADAFARTALDAAEPFDVDVDELARTLSLIADRLLEPEPAQPAQPEPGQDPRDRRERHPERLRDLCSGEAQPAQLHNHRDSILGRAIRDLPRRRAAITQTLLAFQPVAANPLPRTTHADPGGLGRRGQRPTINKHPHSKRAPATPTESRVSVKLHPVTSLGPSCL